MDNKRKSNSAKGKYSNFCSFTEVYKAQSRDNFFSEKLNGQTDSD